MIDFNVPICLGNEVEYINKVINNRKLCGDGEFTKKCHEWLENKTNSNVLLTTSCSHSLDMSAILSDIKAGDEVIMPSYTFVSTANAFVLRGAKIVFVDIRPDTMNIDENLIEAAITDRTKAIVPVHYAGVSCEMDKIMEIAKRYNLIVIEDAAQGVMSEYKGRPLGTIGDFGCYSFHETKNYSMGEGGALIVKSKQVFDRAEIVREKGTDRGKFFRGEVDKYTWVDVGSSFLPSDINAAFLYAQLEVADVVNNWRLHCWNLYYDNLKGINRIELPFVPEMCKHNAHMFFIKTRDVCERALLMEFLKNNGVATVFHYVPLHTSPVGMKFGRFCGVDNYTTSESERILRLPMYYDLKDNDVLKVCGKIREFYECN